MMDQGIRGAAAAPRSIGAAWSADRLMPAPSCPAGRCPAPARSTDPSTVVGARRFVQQVLPTTEGCWTMIALFATWTGLVLGVSLLLVMALGPLIVSVDSYFYDRKYEQQRMTTYQASVDRVSTQP
jgi:hypothetical protein